MAADAGRVLQRCAGGKLWGGGGSFTSTFRPVRFADESGPRFFDRSIGHAPGHAGPAPRLWSRISARRFLRDYAVSLQSAHGGALVLGGRDPTEYERLVGAQLRKCVHTGHGDVAI